jgi:hypothetical protein
MRGWSYERLAAASGIVFVVLAVIAGAIFNPPAVDKPTAKIVDYFLQHHRAGLVSAVLAGLALVAFLWFLGSIGSFLRRADELRLGMVALIAGAATVAVAFATVSIEIALTYRVALDAPGMVKGLYELQVVTATLIGFPVGTLIGAVAVAAWRRRLFPLWYTAASAVVAIWVIVSGGALLHSGFYSPTGAFASIGFIAFLVWVASTSIGLMQTAGAAESVAQPATAMM